MRFKNAGRTNFSGAESTAPDAPGPSAPLGSGAGRGVAPTGVQGSGPGAGSPGATGRGRGAFASEVPRPGAQSAYYSEAATSVEHAFLRTAAEMNLVIKNNPANARFPDHQIKADCLAYAYTSLSPESRRIFDTELAPRAQHYSQAAARAKSAERANRTRDEAGPSTSATSPSSSSGSAAAPQNNRRTSVEPQRVAFKQPKSGSGLRLNLSPPPVLGGASRPPDQRFQAPPVVPFQIQRPPQAAMQSSSGYTGNSHVWSGFPTSCPTVLPYVKIGAGLGAVVGIGVGGYLLSKHFTAA